MKLTKSSHKALLTTLFYDETGQSSPEGQPIFKPKQFPFDKLLDAASAAKKLATGATAEGDRMLYKDGDIELTPSEVVILKELFNASKDTFDISTAEAAMELKELFEGK